MGSERRFDLVDRESIKDAIGFMNLHFLGHGENKSVLDAINEVPTVDAVEVVRCKDCKHWLPYPSLGVNDCGLHKGLVLTNENTYCSYGERKNNG